MSGKLKQITVDLRKSLIDDGARVIAEINGYEYLFNPKGYLIGPDKCKFDRFRFNGSSYYCAVIEAMEKSEPIESSVSIDDMLSFYRRDLIQGRAVSIKNALPNRLYYLDLNGIEKFIFIGIIHDLPYFAREVKRPIDKKYSGKGIEYAINGKRKQINNFGFSINDLIYYA